MEELVELFKRIEFTLEVNRSPIEITSGISKIDPYWEYTDKQGHFHYYSKTHNRYPTLHEVEAGMDEDGEIYYDLACSACGEVITPGLTSPSYFREYIPGPTVAEITYKGKRATLSKDNLQDLELALFNKYDYEHTSLVKLLDTIVS